MSLSAAAVDLLGLISARTRAGLHGGSLGSTAGDRGWRIQPAHPLLHGAGERGNRRQPVLGVADASAYGLARRLLLACALCAAASSAEIAFTASPPSALARAGLERVDIPGGWRLICRHAIAGLGEVQLGGFPAQPGRAYSVACTVSASVPAPLTVRIRWRDGRGQDAGELDRQLGRVDPDLSAAPPSGWDGG